MTANKSKSRQKIQTCKKPRNINLSPLPRMPYELDSISPGAEHNGI